MENMKTGANIQTGADSYRVEMPNRTGNFGKKDIHEMLTKIFEINVIEYVHLIN